MKAQKNKKTFFFGFFNKRERWGLSCKGWLISSFVTISFFMFVLKNVYSFLAPTKRVDTKTLVVEGWIGDEGLQLAAEEFKEYNYDHIYVTGGTIEIGGFLLTKHKSYAQLGVETLLKIGIPAKNITPVPAPKSTKDRTYHSALALKKYLEEKSLEIKSFNLFSYGPHCKRSQLLFQKAFENKVEVGIIASNPIEFDTLTWWSSSRGFRTVLSELIAYLYSLFFKYAKLGSL